MKQAGTPSPAPPSSLWGQEAEESGTRLAASVSGDGRLSPPGWTPAPAPVHLHPHLSSNLDLVRTRGGPPSLEDPLGKSYQRPRPWAGPGEVGSGGDFLSATSIPWGVATHPPSPPTSAYLLGLGVGNPQGDPNSGLTLSQKTLGQGQGVGVGESSRYPPALPTGPGKRS